MGKSWSPWIYSSISTSIPLLLLPLGLDSAKHWRQRTEGHEAEPWHGRTKPCTKQASWVHFPFLSLDSGCFSLMLPLVLANTTGGLLCCCLWCNEDDVLRHRPQGRCLIKQLHQQSGPYCVFPQSKQAVCRSDTARMLISWTGAGQGPSQLAALPPPSCAGVCPSPLCVPKRRGGGLVL